MKLRAEAMQKATDMCPSGHQRGRFLKTKGGSGVSFVVLCTEIPKPCRSLKHLKDPKGVGFLRRYLFVLNPKTYPALNQKHSIIVGMVWRLPWKIGHYGGGESEGASRYKYPT